VASSAELRAQAAALLAAGRTSSDVAETIGTDPGTIRRWKREHREQFERAENPEEVYRAQLREALSAVTTDGKPDHRIRLDAAKQLDALNTRRAQAAGPRTLYVVQPSACPSCGVAFNTDDPHPGSLTPEGEKARAAEGNE
jgi:transposase-like protein